MLNKLKAKTTSGTVLTMQLDSNKTSPTTRSPAILKLLISQRLHRTTNTISNKIW